MSLAYIIEAHGLIKKWEEVWVSMLDAKRMNDCIYVSTHTYTIEKIYLSKEDSVI